MEETLILAGSGGCMRELLWQLQELNQQKKAWRVLGYVDISSDSGDVWVGGERYPYLGPDEYLLARKEKTNVAVCVGSSSLRRRIAEKLEANPYLQFPNLVLSNTYVCPDVQMGKGNIISMDCRISTNAVLGDFNFLNMGAVVCHDGRLGSYVTMSPDVRLAGNVALEDGAELGMGARVIQGIRIGKDSVVGAGSVIIRDIPEGATVVGVPGKAR